MLRGLNAFMALLFLVSMAVQVNDSDGMLWALVYACGLIVCVMASLGRYTVLTVIGSFAYLSGFLYLAPALFELESSTNLFTDIRMDNRGVEEAREAGGLLLGGVWLAVLSVVWYRNRRQRQQVPQLP